MFCVWFLFWWCVFDFAGFRVVWLVFVPETKHSLASSLGLVQIWSSYIT